MYGVSGVLSTPSRSHASLHGGKCFSFTSATTSSMFNCEHHQHRNNAPLIFRLIFHEEIYADFFHTIQQMIELRFNF